VSLKDNAEVLSDFDRDTFTTRGITRDVYRMGHGPAVLVISEMPGITPDVAEFSRRVAARNLRVVMPSLFGHDGAPPTVKEVLSTFPKICVSREILLFAKGRASPVTSWLRDLAHVEHERNGGPGVGVVGMCLTGGFALAMMVDPVVVAPVLSQPSLPLGPGSKSELGMSARDLAVVKDRCEAGACVLAYRFTGDKKSPGERFARLRQELGDHFIGVEIDSSPSNPWGYPQNAHSVLTQEYGNQEGSPTRLALAQVLDFFDEQLKAK
jgi:dienelactone hydrolase